MQAPLDPTDVIDPEPVLPLTPALLQNFPNPFNPNTVIAYRLPSSGQVKLFVTNAVGQQAATLVDGNRESGRHTVEWNGRGGSGQRVASGIYFYRLSIGGHKGTRKMVLAK